MCPGGCSRRHSAAAGIERRPPCSPFVAIQADCPGSCREWGGCQSQGQASGRMEDGVSTGGRRWGRQRQRGGARGIPARCRLISLIRSQAS